MGRDKNNKGEKIDTTAAKLNSEKDKDEREPSKKVYIYKRALRRTLAAGAENVFEDPVLKELRSTLNISKEEHEKLKDKIMAELSSLEEQMKESKLKISKIEQQINQLKKKGIDTKIIENLLSRAKDAKAEESYDEFDTYTIQCSRILKNLQRNYQIYQKLKQVKNNITQAEKMGANVNQVKALLKNAETSMEKDDFKAAKDLATKANKLSNELRKFGTAKKQLQKFQQALASAKKDYKVAECDELVKEAQNALKDNNYKKVGSTIKAGNKLLQSLKRHHTATEKVYRIYEMVEQGRDSGLELKNITPIVDQLEKNLEQKEYNKLTKQTAIIRKAIEEARKYKNANDKILEAQQAIEEAKEVGSSVKTANRLFSQAKAALKKKKYTYVHKYTRSAIKLAKEGKSTAIRRKASSAISSARFLINEVRDFGANVTDAETLLKKADNEFNKMNFDEAQKIAEQAEDVAKVTFDKEKKKYLEKGFQESLLNVNFIIEELDDLDIEMDNIKKLYTEAQEQFEAGDYENAEKLIKNSEALARKTLEDTKYQQRVDKAKEDIIKCKKLLEDAKGLEIDTKPIESLITKAEGMLQDKNYDELLVLTENLDEELLNFKENISKTRTQSIIDSTMALIDEAKNLGADLSEAEAIMGEVKARFEAKRYIEAEELVKHSQEVAKKAWANYRSIRVNRALDNARQVIVGAEKDGINITNARDIINNAAVKINEGEFEAAEELIAEGEAIAQSSWNAHRQKQANEKLAELRKVYSEIQISEEDTKEFENLMSKTEKEIIAKNFEVVNESIKQAESLAFRHLLNERTRTFSTRIEKAREMITKINELDLETKELVKLLAEAEKTFKNNDFENTEKHLDQLENTYETMLFNRRKIVSTKMIGETRETIGKSRKIGANVDEAEKYLSEAEGIISEEDFDIPIAEELLEKAETEAKRSWKTRKSELTANAVSSAKNMIQETKKMGADVSEAEKILQDAEEMFQEEDFAEIDEYLVKVKDMVENTKTQHKSELANQAVTSTKELLAETREMGADVSEATDLLQQAENMFQDEDFDSVDEFVKKAESAIESSKIKFQREVKSKTISTTRNKIDEGREKGADVSEAEDLLTEAENMLMSDGDFELVDNLIQKSEMSLASSWDHFRSQKLIDEVSKMHGKVEQFRSQGLNVSKAEEILHQAEIEFKSEKLDKVEELLQKVGKIVKKDYEDEINKKITLKISEVQNQIKNAKEMGLDVSSGEELLKKAMTEFDNKNFNKAEEFAKKANEIVTELLDSFEKEETEKILDRVQSLILDAKVFNIDVSPAERLFRQAKALFKTGEYKSCKDYALKSENILNTLAKKYIKDIHPYLTVDVDDKGLQANKWNKLRITISNDGQIKAQNIQLGFKGEFEIKGKKKIEELDPEKPLELEVGINSKKVGEVPIKILLKCVRPFDLNEYKFTHDVKIKFSETGKFVIQDIFLIYIDGCLILHKTREYRELVDEDIFSGMLVAVQNFVTDSFRKTPGEGLRRLDFGKSKILMESGPKFFIALVMEGEEPGALPLFMVETINEIQNEFGDILQEWDGNLENLNGIEDLVNKLLYLEVIPGTDELRVGEEYESTVIKVRSMIFDVKELGVETSEAEEVLHKAETIVESSDYSKVIDHIELAQNMVKKARRDYYHDEVKDAISTVKDEISSAQADGVEVKEAEELFKIMKDLVQDEAFPEVLEKAKAVKELVQTSKKQNDTNKAYDTLGNNLALATEWGLDISALETQKNEIDSVLESKDYDKASEMIKNFYDQFKESVDTTSVESLDLIKKLNSNIDEAKQYGLDTTVSETQKYINSAIESIKELDLPKASELVEKANEKITEDKKEYFHGEATKTIDTVKKSMNELRNLDVDIKDAENLLNQAENNFNKQDFTSALQVASDLQEQLEKAKEDHITKPIMDSIIKTEAHINKAKVHGIDEVLIHPVEEMLGMARLSIDAREFEAAEYQIKEALSLANENFEFLKSEKDDLRAQLDDAMDMLTSSKEIGMDTSEVENLMGRMKEVLDGGDLEETKNYMENIQKTLEGMQIPYKIQVLNQDITRLEKYLNETKEKGIDTKEVEHLIENAKTMLFSEDLETTEEYIKNSRELLDKANKNHRAIVISETIQSTVKLVNDVKELGAEVTYAEDLLRQAGEMLKDMNLDAAEECVTNALTAAQDVKQDFLSKEAKEQMTTAEKAITKAKGEGLNTTDAERFLKQANDYLNSYQPQNAKQYAMNAQQLINDIKERKKGAQAREVLVYVQESYEELKSKGAEVLPVEAPLIQAQASLDNKDYDMALTYIQTAKKNLIEIKRPFSIRMAKEAISNANKKIIDARNYGADISTAQNLFDDAKNAFTNKDYESAEEKAKKAEKLALVAQEKYYDNYVSNEIKTIKENIDQLKNQGHNISKVEDELSKINTMYLNKDFQGIGENIKNIRTLLIKLEEDKYVDRAKDEISFSKAMIGYIKHNIKDIGARIKQPERILKSAEELLKNKDYARAEQLALESQRAVENIKQGSLEQFLFVFRQLQAEEMLTQTKNVISNIKKLGVDLSEAEDVYKQAGEAFKSDETFNQGKELLTQAKIIAHEKENQFQEKNASSAISTAESLILTLKQNGVDVETAEKFLTQAKSALEIREFKKSILFAGKAKFTAKKLMAEIPVTSTAQT